MDFNFDSVTTADPARPLSSTRPLFEYSSAGAGSSTSDPENTTVDVSSFKHDGFSDFSLDLSCLSNPPSPADPHSPLTTPENALNILPAPSPSSPLLPVDESSQSSPREETPSTDLSTLHKAKSLVRGSLPAMRYVGRGTPIDPGRRFEWGGRRSEDVAEDGRLFSSDRPRSLESHTYPHRRSSSYDWQVVPAPRTLSPLHMDLDSALEDHAQTYLEPLPESSKIQVQVDSDPMEWDSVMQTVLQSSGALPSPESRPALGDKTSSRRSSQGPVPGLPQHPNGFDIVLGLNSALDLGLGLGRGMNFFDLGLIPDSGRESPSVYSDAPETPRASSPASIDKQNRDPGTPEAERDEELEQEREGQREQEHSSDGDRSGTTTANVPTTPSVVPFEPKAMRDVHKVRWWNTALSKLRKVQKYIKSPPTGRKM